MMQMPTFGPDYTYTSISGREAPPPGTVEVRLRDGDDMYDLGYFPPAALDALIKALSDWGLADEYRQITGADLTGTFVFDGGVVFFEIDTGDDE